LHIGAYTRTLLTTDEPATYLRLSEHKLYELVAAGPVPFAKVTGRWLFPRGALDRWVMAGLIAPAALARTEAPPIVGGSQNLLLESALREGGCGIAGLPEGNEVRVPNARPACGTFSIDIRDNFPHLEYGNDVYRGADSSFTRGEASSLRRMFTLLNLVGQIHSVLTFDFFELSC
jgi:excisionase family DNA binding protein